MTSSFVERDKIFAEIDEAFRKFTADPELMFLYEGRRKAQLDKNSMISDAHKEGLAEGEAKGKAEGKAEGRTEDARNLKRLGVATDIIVQATGLTKDEVESL